MMQETESAQDSSKPIPALIEHAVAHLAPFVLSSSGLQGLLNFRLVCRLWNQVGAELWSKQNFVISISQEASEDSTEEVTTVTRKSKIGVLERRGRPIQDFIAFERWRCEQGDESSLVFHNFHLYQIRDKIMDFLDSTGPWATNVTTLHLSDFTVLDYNSLIPHILGSLPNLSFLRCDLDKEVALPTIDYADLIESVSSLAISDKGDEQAQHGKMKEFFLSIPPTIQDPEQVKRFQWDFIQLCPNLENFRIDMEASFSTATHPFPKLLQDIQALNPKISSFDAQGVYGMESQLATFINSFSPKTLKLTLYDSRMNRLFQQLNPASCRSIITLDLLLVALNSKTCLMDLLFCSVQPEHFPNLKTLKLQFERCRGDAIITTVYKVPKFPSVREVHFRAFPAHERQVNGFYENIPQAFPNLEAFRAKPKTSTEVHCLLLQLSKLKKLEQLYLQENVFRMECLTHKELFGDATPNSSYKGLLALPKLRDLLLTYDPKRGLLDDSSIEMGFSKMPALKRLRVTRPADPQMAQNLLDKLEELTIKLEFVKLIQ